MPFGALWEVSVSVDFAVARRVVLLIVAVLMVATSALAEETPDALGMPSGTYVRLDAPITVGSTFEEPAPLRTVVVSISIVHHGKAWVFARGTKKSRVFREIWTYTHVTGSRYWIAYDGTNAFRLSVVAHDWEMIPIPGTVMVFRGSPLFVTVEEGGQYVYWGDEIMGPFKDMPRIERTQDDVLIAVVGQPEPIPFVDCQD